MIRAPASTRNRMRAERRSSASASPKRSSVSLRNSSNSILGADRLPGDYRELVKTVDYNQDRIDKADMKRILLVCAILSLSLAGCGKDGAPGTIGPPGKSGSTIVASFQCVKLTSQPIHLALIFNGVQYDDGDLWVSCAVSDGATQSANSELYRAGQPGATSQSCIVIHDVSGAATVGFWQFSANGTGKKAVYNDSGDPADQTTALFTSSADCTVLGSSP